MSRSTIQITGEDTRQFYYNAILMKISDLKRFHGSVGPDNEDHRSELMKLIRQARSFKNMFNIKNTVITLTRSDVDLLTRILNTSA